MSARAAVLWLAALALAGCRDDRGAVAVAAKPGPATAPVQVEEGPRMKRVEHRSGAWSPELNEAENETLFAIADDTLQWCTGGSREPFAFETYALTPALRRETATFVTLKINGRLRGCIGSLAPVAPLYQSVHDNAVNAAMRDHRFPRVTPQELERIDVHISILSPITDIPSIDHFRIGEHGIILEKGFHRAVYLPEVAVEQQWDVEQTLASLSRKAGMNADAWREGARFKVFSSVVISRE